MLPVAILAGGLATRLLPVTEKIPKSLVEIEGRPFIFYQLEMLRRQGIDRVVLCLGHLGEQVETVVGDGKKFGLSVRYSFDGPTLRGTGGAIQQALPQLGPAFFVLYGDSYLRCSFPDIEARFHAAGRPALMTVLRNNNQWDKSNVRYKDGQILEYNKRNPTPDMDYIDFGLGILSASVFQSRRPDEAFDLADLYEKLSRQEQLSAYEVGERFFEIGSHSGITEFTDYLRAKEPFT